MEQARTYRNTKQRTRIMELLCGTESHPTASWLYDQLKPEFPALSLGTVYRNLGILEEQGMIKKIVSGSTFDRFDANVLPHAHFRCIYCGNVYDMKQIDLSAMRRVANERSAHQIMELSIEYRGMCEMCKETKEKE